MVSVGMGSPFIMKPPSHELRGVVSGDQSFALVSTSTPPRRT